MSDRLSLKVISGPTKAEMRAMTLRTDRATQWALREVGRRVTREARKRAPVYKGPDRTVSYGDGKHGPIVPGELKRGIKSSRRIKREGGGRFSLKVGPRGGHVHLYSKKQEARTPYMAPAYQAAKRDAAALHAKAWERAMRR